MLDATPMGRPLYEKVGFEGLRELDRMVSDGVKVQRRSSEVSPIRPRDLAAAIAMDGRFFGVKRAALIKSVYADAPHLAWQVRRRGRIAGFCMGRKGTRYYLGPLMAGNIDDAMALAAAAFEAVKDGGFIVDIPACQAEFRNWLSGIGFTRQRSFTRMSYGKAPRQSAENQFAIAGPEFG